MRQWVFSVPFELRLLLARRADAFRALIRIFAGEVERLQAKRARLLGLERVRFGGVSFPQRFGGSLNLNTHVHAVFADGMFTARDGDTTFHALPAPETKELGEVCLRVASRLHRWLRKRDLLRGEDEEPFSAPEEVDAIETCTRGYRQSMSDFSEIVGYETWVYRENERMLDLLTHELRPGDVVVTHHLPTFRSVAPRFSGSPSNAYFVCDVEDLILERRPRLWIHGHTHDSVDRMVGSTRILCNPFGYAGWETNPDFVERSMVELAKE